MGTSRVRPSCSDRASFVRRFATTAVLVSLWTVGHFGSARSEGAAGIAEPAAGGAPAIRRERFEIDGARPDPAFPGVASAAFGSSTLGDDLIAFHRKGSSSPTRTVLVFGVIHGDELGGRSVVEALLTAPIPADLELWLVPSINPDAERPQQHRNSNGVDLNRNFPINWETGTPESSGKHFAGAAPASEVETRATMALIEAIRPDVTVWYHQPLGYVDCNTSRVGDACVTFAAAVGLSTGFRQRPGTATDWVMSNDFGLSFVVELPAGAPSTRTVDRHVAAIISVSV